MINFATMQIAHHIQQLLLAHDCVSIPNFGGMVAQRFRAEINAGTNMMRPPSKRISYHKDLVANAHLLVQRIANEHKISEAKASAQIAKTVDGWKQILAEGSSVKLEGVGRFYNDKEGFVCFNQSLESNFDLDAFGLDMFRATAIKRESEIKEAVSVAISESVDKTNTRFPFWRAAAVFAGIGLLLTVGYFKTDFSIKENMLANFNPLHYSRSIDLPTEVIEEIPEENTTEEIAPAKEEAFLGDVVTVNYNDAKHQSEMPVAKEKILPHNTNQLPYQVIVGSFKDLENATELILELTSKGYSPEIIDDNTAYTKVSIEGFSSRAQAVQAMRAYKLSVNKSAWVFNH